MIPWGSADHNAVALDRRCSCFVGIEFLRQTSNLKCGRVAQVGGARASLVLIVLVAEIVKERVENRARELLLKLRSWFAPVNRPCKATRPNGFFFRLSSQSPSSMPRPNWPGHLPLSGPIKSSTRRSPKLTHHNVVLGGSFFRCLQGAAGYNHCSGG